MFKEIHKNNKRCSQMRCPEIFKSEKWFLKSQESVLWDSLSLTRTITLHGRMFWKNAVFWEQKHYPRYVSWLLWQLCFSRLGNTAVECDYQNYLKTSELLEYYILKSNSGKSVIYFIVLEKYFWRINWQMDYLNNHKN